MFPVVTPLVFIAGTQALRINRGAVGAFYLVRLDLDRKRVSQPARCSQRI